MPAREEPSESYQERERPGMVTLLSILVLLAALFQFLKFGQTLTAWSVLASLPLTVPPAYLGTVGLLWGIAGIFFSWSLWTGKPWSCSAGLIISLSYAAYFWIDRIWIAEPDRLLDRWPLNLAWTWAALAGIWLILSHHLSRAYFREKSC